MANLTIPRILEILRLDDPYTEEVYPHPTPDQWYKFLKMCQEYNIQPETFFASQLSQCRMATLRAVELVLEANGHIDASLLEAGKGGEE